MQRITTTVDPEVYARLEDLSRRAHVPVARLIREAMERYVTEREAELGPEPLPDWVGMLAGPGDPYAEVDEEVLAADWAGALEPAPAPDTKRRPARRSSET